MFALKYVIISLLFILMIPVSIVSDILSSRKDNNSSNKRLLSHSLVVSRFLSAVKNKFNFTSLRQIITDSFKILKIRFKNSPKNQEVGHKEVGDRFRNAFRFTRENNNNLFAQNENNISYRNLRLNKFADMTINQALKIARGFKVSDKLRKRRIALKLVNNDNRSGKRVRSINNNNNNNKIPDEWDWREFGIVTPVKDQGLCGSCWAHTACATLESHFAKSDIFCHNRQSKQKDFSEQQLIDCTDGDCDGGVVQDALNYIKDNGLTDENTYPYTETDIKCNYKPATKVSSCDGFIDFEPDNEELLKQKLYFKGPIASAVYVTPILIRYRSGIFGDPWCPSDKDDVNHAVTIVGYGIDDQKHYWIIKNSWGESWGENGYFRLERNNDNMCGIASYPCYPNIAGLCDTNETMFSKNKR